MIPRGVRGRLVVTVIALVALTSLVLGVGAYVYVAGSLRDQELQSARDLTAYNVGVLAVERLPAQSSRQDLLASRLLEGFAARGIAATIVDFGDGNPYLSGFPALGASGQLSARLRSIVASGQIGYDHVSIGGVPYLVVGARRPPAGPAFYFLFDASEVESAIARLGQALIAGGVLLVVLAALAAGALARRLLAPVALASSAAERIAAGDLATRIPVDSTDEFGAWAASFNRMAASLEEKVGQLQAAEARERRFTADVSHELRTPLTALVAEASVLREHLDALPADDRRVAALLVADVARLRALVDDLMEISRFDASAETLEARAVNVAAFLASVAASRAPTARLSLPPADEILVADWRRVERIVGNLLDNARVHADGRGVELGAVIEPGGAADRDDEAPPTGSGTSAGGQTSAGAGASQSARASAAGPQSAGLTLVVAVSDRGPGVDPDDLPRLFDRFHKGDPSRHRGGSGLGLAIARENARLLGGSLEASPRPGGGLRVELRVPVTRLLPGGDRDVTGEADPEVRIEPATESSR